MGFTRIIPAIYTYRYLLQDVKRQRKFLHAHVVPVINRYRRDNDGSLDEEDFKKILNYYGFGVPAIVGEAICTLRGRPMTERERLCSTFQGALTGLYDDFFDKTGLSDEQILDMMNHPDSWIPKTALEKLFIEFLKNVYQNLDLPEYFNHYFHKVFLAQQKSLLQTDPGISYDDILEITYDKGGYSLLFYRSAFTIPATVPEENALFRLGSLMQLGNDIFDVWKDSPQGIRTPVTASGKISRLRKIFINKLQDAMNACDEAGFKAENLFLFRRKFILAISRCFVCMDQLERLEQGTGGVFNPKEYSREQLVCDMERPLNILKAIGYFLKNRHPSP
ncbi:MAG: hypothetical protein KKA81_14635 [Bacteroidetes bacterium]|nr:hypothetical protein [Bacteroidota bacterium]